MISDTKSEPRIEYIREALEHIQSNGLGGSVQRDFDQLRISMYWDDDSVPQEDTMAQGRRRRIQPERMTANELRREVDLISALYPYPAEIGVQYVGEGSRSEKRAEMIERGLNEAIDQLNPGIDAPILRERWSMCLLGRAARLICPGDMYWWNFPDLTDDESLDEWDRRHNQWVAQAPIPICWTDLPAESTFPTSFGRMSEEVVSWQKVTNYDLHIMFSPEELARANITKDIGLDEEYTLVIFSNLAWLAYGILQGDVQQPYIDGIVRSIEHKLGVPAIQIIPGNTSGRKEVGKFWQGVSDASISLIKAANRRLSEAATASKFDALPIFKSWMQEDTELGEGAQSDNLLLPNGDIIPLRTGGEGLEKEDIEPLFNPRYGEKTLAMAQFALQRAERNSGAVEALEGATGPSGEPAWSRNSVIEQSKMKHSRLSQAVAASDLMAAEMISRSVISFNEDVPISRPNSKGPKIILKPTDLKDFRVVLKSEYKMKLPVSRRADIQLGVSIMAQAKEAGLPVSPAWVMENVMDIQQPLEEFKRSLTWELLMSDESKAFYKQLLVKESELDLAQEEGMSLGDLQPLVDSGQLPPQIAQQLLELAGGNGQKPPSGGSNQARKFARAGIPFSTNPTGPQPSQEIPPAAVSPY